MQLLADCSYRGALLRSHCAQQRKGLILGTSSQARLVDPDALPGCSSATPPLQQAVSIPSGMHYRPTIRNFTPNWFLLPISPLLFGELKA